METVVGIDPGRDKCGVAVLTPEGHVLERAVVARADLEHYVGALANRYRVRRLVLGDRTGSDEVAASLERAGLAEALGGISRVDEHMSSVEGRALYWRSRPPRGWRRLVPTGMLTPPEPYDGWVAEVLVRRYLSAVQGRKRGADEGSFVV